MACPMIVYVPLTFFGLESKMASDMMKKMLRDLNRAIKKHKYDDASRIAHAMLDASPSEEADRCLHDIIGSINTIRDAEDEISYQYEDLASALDEVSGLGGKEVDGL